MNHRLRILRDATKFYKERGPHNYGAGETFPSFREGDPEYLAALNQLIREELILGVNRDDVVGIGLNPDRLADIRKELYPWYRIPGSSYLR